ncbi:helix-turn-helix domain-containing protein [Streptomyces nanshensis]|uniref:helix-turn-helix domain-containing protein n=1 Tax=Streptomyces nanshensis TaxID=518642 RepID=UPI001FD33A81|nr:helix-turn-helix domain-containing protein [Streptomyces nanshensis]
MLACAEGLPNAQVALDLGVSREMVRKWWARFLADRLEGLVDRPRSGRRGRSRTSRSRYWLPGHWTRRDVRSADQIEVASLRR